MMRHDESGLAAIATYESPSSDLRPDFATNLALARHRWFSYKEGFSAELVRHALIEETQRQPGIVLDPFAGSGTTLVEASRWGWRAFGLEVNPFSAFLARTKVRTYNRSRLSDVAHRVLDLSRRHVLPAEWKLPRDSTLVARPGLEKWLFNAAVARRFEQYRYRSKLEGGPEAGAVLLALIAAMGDVANARRDGKCWRYRTDWKRRDYDADDLETAFRARLRIVDEDLSAAPGLPGRAFVRLCDSRVYLNRTVPGPVEMVDAIVSSPPYVNSFDYTDIYRPEMFLLGVARTSADLRTVRFRSLRSHLQVDWDRRLSWTCDAITHVSQRIEREGSWNPRLGLMVRAYFDDLHRVVSGAARRLRLGGTICFVVARSAYCGVVVPVDDLLAEVFGAIGLRVERVEMLRTTLGNGHHQLRQGPGLQEARVIARKVHR